MKKSIALVILMAFVSVGRVSAWGRLGHEIVIAIAERHLTTDTKGNISKYFPYDLKEDAIWMDTHRNDERIAVTTHWHSCYFDNKMHYDPFHPKKMKTGDVVRALNIVEGCLGDERYKELADSSVVLCVRMLIHFVGDAHCPSHNYHTFTSSKWNCKYKGKKSNFHMLYDRMPNYIWGKMSADDIAAKLDNASRCQRRKIASEDMYSWLSKVAGENVIIYEWNPPGTPVLREDTVEISEELVNMQLRNAGYRLAFLLNKYFGK